MQPPNRSTPVAAEPEISPRAGAWAWALCWLMFVSTVLNYMDRQAITLVKGEISQAFSIPDFASFGWVISAFTMTYALFQVPAGFLVDRWDLRSTYAAAVAWWSLAAIATAMVPSLGWLFACRALLGVGESFNWPCALRVTARILPPKDRSLGNGIFNSGAAVGAVLTPIVVTVLLSRVGWRPTFLVIGSLGFVWVGAWLFLVRGERGERLAGRSTDSEAKGESPARLPRPRSQSVVAFVIVGLAAIGSASLAVRYGPTAVWFGIAIAMLGTLAVAAWSPKSDLVGMSWATSLHDVARIPRFWVLVVVSITINIPWHFLVNWLPEVLKNDRLMSQTTAGYLTAATFLAADAGNLGGGFLSRSLVGKGMTVVRARKTAMALCMLLILAGPAVSIAHADYAVIALIAAMAAGIAAFMANYFSFTQEVSARHTGLISGYLGGLGNLAVAAYVPFAGALRDRTGSFGASFLIVGLLPLVGIILLFAGWGERDAAKRASSPGFDDF